MTNVKNDEPKIIDTLNKAVSHLYLAVDGFYKTPNGTITVIFKPVFTKPEPPPTLGVQVKEVIQAIDKFGG